MDTQKRSATLINTDRQIDNNSPLVYNSSVTLTRTLLMSVIYSQAQKQRYRITLDIEVMEDFDPHQINWEELFKLEGSERVIDSYVEDLSKPVRW